MIKLIRASLDHRAEKGDRDFIFVELMPGSIRATTVHACPASAPMRQKGRV